MTRTIVPFLVVFVALSFNGAALGGVPITALLLEFEKLKTQIEEADVDQEVKDQALELWVLAQSIALSPNHPTSIKMKQLEIVECTLLNYFPLVGNSIRLATLNRIRALLAEGSEAPDKPVQRDLPEVASPVAACKVEILELNTDRDAFELAPSRIVPQHPFGHVFLTARASEPGTVNWFEIQWVKMFFNEGGYEIGERKMPLVVPLPEFGQSVQAAENSNGILEILMTHMSSSRLTEEGSVRVIQSIIRAEFSSADGQRRCEDRIRLTWHR